MVCGQMNRACCRKWMLCLLVPFFVLAYLVGREELAITTYIQGSDTTEHSQLIQFYGKQLVNETKRSDLVLPTESVPIRRTGSQKSDNVILAKVERKNTTAQPDKVPSANISVTYNSTKFAPVSNDSSKSSTPAASSAPTASHPPPMPRLLCWILTDRSLASKTSAVRNTWAKRCDVTLYMSSKEDKLFPMIGLNVTEGRSHIASKARAAWQYVYKHHFNDADFFMKADPDTYVIVDNLKEYLKTRDPSKNEYYGHRFKPKQFKYTYMSGGPGHILSREALRRLVNDAFNKMPNCMPDGEGEDYKTGKCLSGVGGRAVDTRDQEGRETFLVFNPRHLITAHFPEWYFRYDMNGAMGREECCSRYPISFHYIKPEEMPLMEFFIYRVNIGGQYLMSKANEKHSLIFMDKT